MATITHGDLPIPGSLVLVDVDGRSGGGHDHGDIILHPTPSSDANDPLRWTRKRKMVHAFMLFIYTMTTGMASASLYSVLTPISENTGIPISTLNAGTGYMFLLLGWGGLITQPLGAAFGKRPLYLITALCHLATVVWMGYIKTESSWLANKVLQGFFAAPIEFTVEVSISDIFYAHERGFFIGMYALTLFTSNFVAPIWAGFVNDRYGYLWVFWVSAIQLAFGIVVQFFFLEETNYNRGTTELGEAHDVDAPVLEDHGGMSKDRSNSGPTVEEKNLTTVTVQNSHLDGRPHSFVYKLGMFRQRWVTWPTFWAMMYRPALLLRFPVVFWSGLLYGSALVWFNVLNATSSMIYSGRPYNFAAASVGLTYFGPTIGAFLAAGWSGLVSDRFQLWVARRHHGVREPEDRLWLLTVNAVLLPAGLILWGVGAAQGIHWIGLCIGGLLVAFNAASAGAFAINYALDSYKDLSSEVMLSIMLVRNSLSFAIGYGITPWLGMGYRNTFITAAFVGMVVILTFVPMIKFGKKFRKRSSAAYWRYVESSVMPAI